MDVRVCPRDGGSGLSCSSTTSRLLGECSVPETTGHVSRCAASTRAGVNGYRGLSGVATCNDNVWIRSVRLATPIPEDVTIAPLTAIASTLCQLNGASTADAVALANTYRENIGAVGGVVLTRRFGGPRRPLNSAVGMRFIFENFAAFGAGMDALEQMAPTANPGNPISCSTGTLSRSYRIYSQNN